MKKCLALFAAVIISVSVPMGALASGAKTYHMKKANIDLSIKTDWMVFVPPVSDKDENLSWYGMTGKELTEMLNKNDIALNAVHDMPRLGLTVNVTDDRNSSIVNLKKETDEQKEKVFKAHENRDLSEVGKAFPELMLDNSKGKINITGHTIFKTNHADFLTLRGNIQSPVLGNSSVYQAVTILNGKNIILTLYGIGEDLSDDDIQVLNDVMNSVKPNAGQGKGWMVLIAVILAAVVLVGIGIFYYKMKRSKQVYKKTVR